MPETRRVAVMGATGRQGRGVVDALLYTQGPITYEVIPLTRSLKSPNAKEFSLDYPQLSLVSWKQDDVETLKQCFKGCYGIFMLPGLILKEDMAVDALNDAELDLGKRCIEAAEASKVSHLIYPTFPSIKEASDGKIQVRNFEIAHQICLSIQHSHIPSTILCPGPFYTDFYSQQYAYWESDTIILSTPAEPEKRMGWADPGHDIGWFTRAVLDAGPEFMKGLEIPVCGQSISYVDLADKVKAVTGIKAEYRVCSVEEFVERVNSGSESGGEEGSRTEKENESVKTEEVRELGKWLKVAPDDRACYGTVDAKRLEDVERELDVRALSWEMFLERTRWKGPPR